MFYYLIIFEIDIFIISFIKSFKCILNFKFKLILIIFKDNLDWKSELI